MKLPDTKIHLAFGSAFHAGIESLLKTNNIKSALTTFDDEFTADKVNKEEREKVAEMNPLGHKMLIAFESKVSELDFSYGIKHGKSEIWLPQTILEDPFSKEKLPLKTVGIIDRMTDSGSIIELKTSKGEWNPDDVKFKLQTQLYSWMYYQNSKGRHPEKVVYVIVTKHKEPRVQIIEANCTKDDYSKLFAEIKAIFAKIENNIFDKPEGFHNNWCDCQKFEEALSTN